MISSVTIQDKKSFIQWFLNHYRLKKRESFWVLNYLANHQEALENLHFVHDVKYTARGIMITAKNSDEASFLFYRNNIVTTDVEKSFHDIRLNPHEDLYVQLNFNFANQTPEYAAVLEENPFVPEDAQITNEDREHAEQLLASTIIAYEREQLIKRINQALDDKDKKLFSSLTEQLQKLEDQPPS